MDRLFQMVFLTVLTMVSLSLAACGGGGGSGDVVPPPAVPQEDLSGVWAGTWEGSDPVFGLVTGNWEAEVVQSDTDVSGLFILSGDVDCAEGSLSGQRPLANDAPTGRLDRPPCSGNAWELTALDLPGRQASGSWTQDQSGASGSYTGSQIAVPDGPRIKYFTPPGGLPGTLVTLVGERFEPLAMNNLIDFSGTVRQSTRVTGTTVLLAEVPVGAGLGPMTLETSAGTAFSPVPFLSQVTHPGPVLGEQFFLQSPQQGAVVSADGRRLYLAVNNALQGVHAVEMFDTATNTLITSVQLHASEPVQGLVLHPNGRLVYVANGNAGVRVLHGVTLELLDTLTVSTGDGSQPNPQGLAVSPEGSLLLVADCRDGGSVAIVDLATGQMFTSVNRGATSRPYGVAFHPDGSLGYLLFASASGVGELIIYDFEADTLLDSTALGNRPVGLAITPDGSELYVANRDDDSVMTVDTLTGLVVASTQVDPGPLGLSVSPDGAKIYVASFAGDSLTILDTASGLVEQSLSVGRSPVLASFMPNGRKAYLVSSGDGRVNEIGGSVTLQVTKVGNGIGTVTSTPAAISCGGSCQSDFDIGSQVRLVAQAGDNSRFQGWGGDADCADGLVLMDRAHYCTARFDVVPVDPDVDDYYYGSCFIATAAFGSYLEPEVLVLREFRDNWLLTNNPGQILVEFYYRHSPPLADYIAERPLLRSLTRLILSPLVYALKYPGLAMVFLLLSGWLVYRFVRRIRSHESASRPG